MRAVDESCQRLRLDLIMDFRLLFPKDLDSIMSDWERGSHHIRYETQIKLCVYQQLHFLLCAIADVDNLPKAVECMQQAVEQFESTKHSKHHVETTEHHGRATSS